MQCSVFWITPMHLPWTNKLGFIQPNLFFLFKQPHFSVQKQDKSKRWRFFFLNKSEISTSNWDFRWTNPSMGRFHQTFPWFSYDFPSQSVVSPWLFPINPLEIHVLTHPPGASTQTNPWCSPARTAPAAASAGPRQNHPARAKRATRSGRPLPGDVGAIDGTEMVFTIVDFDNYR